MTESTLWRGYFTALAIAACFTVQARLSSQEKESALARFKEEVWPLLVRGDGKQSCVGCHDEENKSELHYYPDAESNFRMLLSRGYFDPDNPDSLLGRVSATSKSRRMPPGKRSPWNAQEVARLRGFVETVPRELADRQADGDERFPPELLEPFRGPITDGLDNTFLSYRQLEGKVRAIFDDDGRRGDRNLFQENIALFGGADFERSFTESSKATAGFLGALDTVAREVAARAYIQRTGPFARRAVDLVSPIGLESPDEAYRVEIQRLYRSILFREPTPVELGKSFQFLKTVCSSPVDIEKTDYELSFLLTVEDETGAFKSTREVSLPVTGSGLGLTQESIDQSLDESFEGSEKVASHDRGRLAYLEPAAPPPPGEVRYHVDQSDDTVAFWELTPHFQFGEDDYVEIGNEGTRERVVADAMKFVPVSGGSDFLVDNHEADGKEDWKNFPKGGANNNRVGPDVYHDENKRKGEVSLRYRPSTKESWKKTEFYRVLVGNPGGGVHERQTPVVVNAMASTPVIRLAHPDRASLGSTVTLDASTTFTLQRANLRFHWEQTQGPEVRLEPVEKGSWSVVTLRPPPRSAAQAAWVGLCRILLNHPDFLFTRPPSVAKPASPEEKRRLQLMKIALDLVGRPPTREEIDKLKGSASFEELVEHYLGTKEFEDFYFRRIRLYLESHGTEVEDEPVRLWCYVAFNDLPSSEILTADYTVDGALRKQARPEYHGKSGILTTAGFIEGKPGLPHFNYAAQLAEKFLGYVFDVSDAVVEERDTGTALSTTQADSVCYSCHKLLTPLAYQRSRWDDKGQYRTTDSEGKPIDDSDRGLVPSYPFRGRGMEAFAARAVRKERFLRTLINTHFVFFFGREMRHRGDERALYKELWDRLHADRLAIRGLIRAILASPEYLEGRPRMSTVSETAGARAKRTSRL